MKHKKQKTHEHANKRKKAAQLEQRVETNPFERRKVRAKQVVLNRKVVGEQSDVGQAREKAVAKVPRSCCACACSLAFKVFRIIDVIIARV
jgi:hypothetical protein